MHLHQVDQKSGDEAAIILTHSGDADGIFGTSRVVRTVTNPPAEVLTDTAQFGLQWWLKNEAAGTIIEPSLLGRDNALNLTSTSISANKRLASELHSACKHSDDLL